jgi:hypothetical protein
MTDILVIGGKSFHPIRGIYGKFSTDDTVGNIKWKCSSSLKYLSSWGY